MSDGMLRLANEVATAYVLRDPKLALKVGFRADYLSGIYAKIFRACIAIRGERTALAIASHADDGRVDAYKKIIDDVSQLDVGEDPSGFVSKLRRRHQAGTAKALFKQQFASLKGDEDEILNSLPMFVSGVNKILQDAPDSISSLELLSSVITSLEKGGTKIEPTRIRALDAVISGVRPGNLIVLAARPGMGKTAFGLQVLLTSGLPSAFLTLEQPAEEMGVRMLCNLSETPNTVLSQERIPDNALARLATAKPPSHLNFVEGSGLQLSEVCAHIRREAAKGAVLVFIDYLNLIIPPPADRHDLAIGMISSTLKNLAKELDITIILASQLNRDLEKRTNKRPRLSDLRDSGALEQDADIVIFLYRPHVYNPSKPITYAEAIVAKNRHGALGTAQLRAELQYCKFTSN